MAQNLCFPMVLLVFCVKRGFHFLSCAHCYGSEPMFSYGFTGVLHERGVPFLFVRALLWPKPHGFPMVFHVFCMKRGFILFVRALLWPQTYGFPMVFACVLHGKGGPFI